MQSTPLLMLDTAEYFEQRRELDKAVLLYQKAGKERRALELCFSANLLDTLASIASNLTAQSDPAMMARCGELTGPACVTQENMTRIIQRQGEKADVLVILVKAVSLPTKPLQGAVL